MAVRCIIIPEIADIWIQDLAPIPVVDIKGKPVAVRAVYRKRKSMACIVLLVIR